MIIAQELEVSGADASSSTTEAAFTSLIRKGICVECQDECDCGVNQF